MKYGDLTAIIDSVHADRVGKGRLAGYGVPTGFPVEEVEA